MNSSSVWRSSGASFLASVLLSASTNEELVSIANRVEQEIHALDWEVGPEDDRPDRDEIMNRALWVIYGDGGA